MSTKEQERKALAQIEAIIGSLGEDSYVATAFAGCCEDARQNIENDFACSWKDRAERARVRLEAAEYDKTELRAKVNGLKSTMQEHKAELDELREDMRKAIAEREMLLKQVSEVKAESTETVEKLKCMINQQVLDIATLSYDLSVLHQQIVLVKQGVLSIDELD